MKTEKEKMLNGELYDCGDPELFAIWCKAKELMQKYNSLNFTDRKVQKETLTELLGSHGENIFIAAPFFVDYGKFIKIGNNTEINMNCVFLDCNWITIGHNCLIAPNVQIYTVGHPVKASDRFPQKSASKEFSFAVSLSAPVTIGNYVWIGGGSIILPGVTIGDNVTIGAGSVVNKSIPANSLAVGNPCRVIKKLD